jgi:MFS family permease
MAGVGCGVGALPFYTLSVFVIPLETALGTSRAAVQGAWLMVSAVNAALGPVVGWAVDRWGGRAVGIAGLCGLGLGLAAIGVIAHSIVTLYVAAALYATLGAGTSPVTWTRVVNGWFSRARGLALGLTLMGTGVTAALAPAYAAWAIAEFGWRGGYAALGLVPLAIALPLVFTMLREPPAAHTAAREVPDMSVRTALRQWRFWLILAAFFAVSFGVGGLITSIAPILIGHGLAPSQAAAIAGAVGLAVIIGRAGTGWLIDRIWAPGVAAVLLSLPALSCLILADPALAGRLGFAAAFLIGLAAGAEFDVLAFLTVRTFGLGNYGKLYGIQFSSLTIAAGSAPLIFGLAFDSMGDYRGLLLGCAVMFPIAAVSLLALGRTPGERGP